MQTTISERTPWWRQFWPWFLISLPACAVLASLVTLWLAMDSADSLVVDDYYREGRAINRTIARDARATELGLVATIDRAPEGVRLAMRSGQAVDWPASLELRIVHATRAEQDRLLVLRSIGGGHYVAGGETLPQAGRWTVQLAEASGDWRLASPVDARAPTWRIEARAGGVQ